MDPRALAERATLAHRALLDELGPHATAVVLRLLVMLHAEDRGLLPRHRRALPLQERIPPVAPAALHRAIDALIAPGVSYGALDVEHIGSVHEALMGRERRRSGSHYTPRALAEPIVATALRPVLEALGPDPRPEAILELSICDPAMGSGVFLIAACRALAAELVAAWRRHGMPAHLDGDPDLRARRLVAKRCLHGVDANPIAVDLAKLSLWLATEAKDEPFTFLDHALHEGDALVDASFPWRTRLPAVFERPRDPGFDVIVGNPPFLGGSRISSTYGDTYLAHLLAAHEGAHGNGDLVAHFFRRAFALLREGGTFGLIATNTIAQGDTRATGLSWIAQHGGVIYHATRRLRWPADAAVVVSVVHVRKARAVVPCVLDGREVPRISAFLVAGSTDREPRPLASNAGKCFLGSKIYGQGFLFDDGDPRASPLAEMRRLIARDPRNAERIVAYLGGEELNTHPEHAPHRYVIDFGQMSESEARSLPDLMAIVEARVRPVRLAQNRAVRARYWWRFGETAPALYAAIRDLSRVIAVARISDTLAFTFVPARQVFSEQLAVLAFDDAATFAVISSRVHEIWARFLGSSMKDDLRYTPSDCFETFPFPPGWQHDRAIQAAGHAYHEHRAALMREAREGLTATYRRFHDPAERAPGILRLRELHDAMDRAVLDAYGFGDLRPTCAFLLDRQDGDSPRRRARRKPWRRRWPDEIRDEVLARLFALNEARSAP